MHHKAAHNNHNANKLGMMLLQPTDSFLGQSSSLNYIELHTKNIRERTNRICVCSNEPRTMMLAVLHAMQVLPAA